MKRRKEIRDKYRENSFKAFSYKRKEKNRTVDFKV